MEEGFVLLCHLLEQQTEHLFKLQLHDIPIHYQFQNMWEDKHKHITDYFCFPNRQNYANVVESAEWQPAYIQWWINLAHMNK